jgi:putative copper resistance protein D
MGSTGKFLSSWSLNVPWLVVTFISVVAYLMAARRVTRRHPTQPWPASSRALFVGAIITIVIATMGPVGSMTDRFFWADMSQHILLMMLAAPLVVLSSPVLLALRAANPSTRRRWLVPLLRSPAIRAISHPVVGWCVFTLALLGTHITPLFEYSLEHAVLRTFVVPLIYFAAGLIYYYPLIGRSPGAYPIPSHFKIVSMFTMMIPEALVGFAIYTTSSVLYPYYEHVTDRPWGPSTPLLDQRVGGSIMWGAGMVLDTIWISIVVAEWWKREEHRSRRLDRLDAGTQTT